MNIINSLVVASLLAGSAWAGDGSFYISNLNVPNDITYVQRQGNVYYVSESPVRELERQTERIRANRLARRAELDRLLGLD